MTRTSNTMLNKNDRGSHWQNEKTTFWVEENTCKNMTDKGLLSKIYKYLIKLNSQKKKKNPIKKWADYPNFKAGSWKRGKQV